MTNTAGVHAKPFAYDEARWIELLDKVCEHRPWFDDRIWDDLTKRRAAAVAYLADGLQFGRVWEVFHGEALVGVMVVNQLNYGSTGTCHFVFFDRQLANKRQLCLSTMDWLFTHLDLQILRAEIPTYAHSLATWARRKLGFRYDTEARPLARTEKQLTERQAALGARRYRTTRYKDHWEDTWLLSITKDEFYGRVIRDPGEAVGRQHSRDSGTVGRRGGQPSGIPEHGRESPDERPSAAVDPGVRRPPEDVAEPPTAV